MGTGIGAQRGLGTQAEGHYSLGEQYPTPVHSCFLYRGGSFAMGDPYCPAQY